MGLLVPASSLLLLILFSQSQTLTIANKKPYIVYLGSQTHGQNPSSMDLGGVTNYHYDMLGSILGSNEKAKEVIFYSYTRHINGFAAILDEEEAAQVAKHPNVVSVFLSKGRRLHTTRSWEFLGLEKDGKVQQGSIWEKARFGEDIIIGNIDTGVWPESKSFSDEGIGPIPSKWRGICQNGAKDGFRCNRKLIGARYFNKEYAFYAGKLNSSFYTARDHDGHGSHTLSAAGGNFVPGASVFGNGYGTAKGGSPKARVAAYKVCWPPVHGTQCFGADVLAAFDAAISDGVDVLSVSLGGQPTEFLTDSISIGAFHAVKQDILVVTAAGNSGPNPRTVENVSPWMLTVGAGTIDREFTSYVVLGDKKRLKGASLSAGGLPSQKMYPLISAADAKADNASATEALKCAPGTIDSKKVKGKILVCLRGFDDERALKGQQAVQAGAVGMILANDKKTGNDVLAEPHLLPASHINFNDGKCVFDYIKKTKNPMAYITNTETQLGTKPAPFVAQFSSRGPNPIEQAILKPDIIAPGLNIIAAYSEAIGPSNLDSDNRRIPFNVQSGTSMSCPHVSGIAGLLKTSHPDWSPAAIQSAIMTTARARDGSMEPLLDASYLKATPFDFGAGHVDPNSAMDPGLIYDLTIYDYVNFLCARHFNKSLVGSLLDKPYTCPKSFSLHDFNYPSIAIPDLSGDSLSITRIVTNVGSPGTYRASTKAPPGVLVSVKPRRLKFNAIGEKRKFKVTLRAEVQGEPKEYSFGELVWSDGKHNVRSPLVVKHSEK